MNDMVQKYSKISEDIAGLDSEASNLSSINLDQMTPMEIVTLMNEQDKLVARAVEKEKAHIAKAVELAGQTLFNGGRIIYTGAGTSGRLGVIDASECPPTFGVDYDKVVAVIAGGAPAIIKAQEGSEDDAVAGWKDLEALNISDKDLLIGIAVSGRTPYVIGGLEEAKKHNIKTVALTCNANTEISKIADITIAPLVGPEILTGSTRLKSGTAQKMVLNMISTGAMVHIGKCYKNRMVDLKASNEKLKARAIKLVCDLTDADESKALEVLSSANWHVKTSIMMIKADLSAEEAKTKIDQYGGKLSVALNEN